MSRPFYSDAKKAKNVSFFFFVTVYFHAISKYVLDCNLSVNRISLIQPRRQLRRTYFFNHYNVLL